MHEECVLLFHRELLFRAEDQLLHWWRKLIPESRSQVTLRKAPMYIGTTFEYKNNALGPDMLT